MRLLRTEIIINLSASIDKVRAELNAMEDQGDTAGYEETVMLHHYLELARDSARDSHAARRTLDE